MPKLEHIRVERSPLGSIQSALFGTGGNADMLLMSTVCINLKSIVIDYCDVNMHCFEPIWNNCKNLSFLGLAGFHQDGVRPSLQPNKNLKVLRFVDCQVDDDTVIFV
jgi:hypothetical protein